MSIANSPVHIDDDIESSPISFRDFIPSGHLNASSLPWPLAPARNKDRKIYIFPGRYVINALWINCLLPVYIHICIYNVINIDINTCLDFCCFSILIFLTLIGQRYFWRTIATLKLFSFFLYYSSVFPLRDLTSSPSTFFYFFNDICFAYLEGNRVCFYAAKSLTNQGSVESHTVTFTICSSEWL